MSLKEETNICRDVNGYEYEIPIAYEVEEYYTGSNEIDDPSYCVIKEEVEVLETVGLFKKGDTLCLTEEERKEIEDEEYRQYVDDMMDDLAEYRGEE